MKRFTILTTIVIAILLVLGVTLPAAAGNKAPFQGVWYGTDVDGSNVTLTIKEEKGSEGKIFSVSGTDDATGTWCSTRGAGKMTAVGLRTGENSFTASGIWWCLPPGTGTWPVNLTLYPFDYVYDPATDTITDITSQSYVTYFRSDD